MVDKIEAVLKHNGIRIWQLIKFETKIIIKLYSFERRDEIISQLHKADIPATTGVTENDIDIYLSKSFN